MMFVEFGCDRNVNVAFYSWLVGCTFFRSSQLFRI